MEMNPVVDHALIGRVRLIGVPVNFEKTPGGIRCAAPTLGEHTDEVLGELGYVRTIDFGKSQAYGLKDNAMAPGLAVGIPFDDKPATAGNGTMISLVVDSSDKVDRIHAKALALGASDEGAAGPRGDSGFYAGYFRDLDGNKLNVFCYTPAAGEAGPSKKNGA